ncbi:hypothetical protein [Microbacterium dextranolyticum]|nr:hypothetical protein [Microbacterium dextranolyticum]MBM7462902.1 hypothetical protein [Microbacterium dextranolyticum]
MSGIGDGGAPDARVASVPAGWVGSRASRAPLQMLTAEVFNRSFTPSPDATIHVAPLRRPPATLTVVVGLIAAFLVWVVVWILVQAGTTPSTEGPVPYLIAGFFGLVGLYFVISFVNLVMAGRDRRSWSNRECVALGRSGVVIRTQGEAVDIPWSEVTAIRATVTNSDRAARTGRVRIPVLRIEQGARHWDFASFILGASPLTVYTVLHYYWTHPAARAELGTAAAQRKMDAQAGASVPSSDPADAGPPSPAG